MILNISTQTMCLTIDYQTSYPSRYFLVLRIFRNAHRDFKTFNPRQMSSECEELPGRQKRHLPRTS